MILQAALNGARPKSSNEFIPQTYKEIISEAKKIFDAGGRIFHIHIYKNDNTESLSGEDVAKVIHGIRNISRGIKVGISTGDWIVPDLDERIRTIAGWDILPDFASVNMIEEGAAEVVRVLAEKGVKVEAGLNDIDAAEKFLEYSTNKEVCERILIEPEVEALPAALEQLNEIEMLLNKKGNSAPRLLHGYNSTAWPLLRKALEKGYDARIGLEDTLFLENGTPVKGNLELYTAAQKILKIRYIKTAIRN